MEYCTKVHLPVYIPTRCATDLQRGMSPYIFLAGVSQLFSPHHGSPCPVGHEGLEYILQSNVERNACTLSQFMQIILEIKLSCPQYTSEPFFSDPYPRLGTGGGGSPLESL